MSDPYASILQLKPNDLNGYLDVQGWLKDAYDFCVRNNVLTKPQYDAMPKSDQAKFKGKFRAWGTRMGLEIPQGGAAWDGLGAIDDAWQARAGQAAIADRKRAKWQDKSDLKGTRWYNQNAKEEDKDYLVAPNGKMKSGNGQPFGPYTRPGMEHDVAPVSGTLYTV